MQFFSDLLQIYIIVKALKILFEPIQLWNRALLRPIVFIAYSKKASDADEDELFLKSLLPQLKRLNDQKKQN